MPFRQASVIAFARLIAITWRIPIYEVVSRGLISISCGESSVRIKSTPIYPDKPGINPAAEQAKSTQAAACL
jgi:hypothetical protein